jgi:hypothetical protein
MFSAAIVNRCVGLQLPALVDCPITIAASTCRDVMSNIFRSVFVALILLGAGGYIYFAAQILKIRGEWSKVVTTFEKNLATQQDTNSLLADGDLKAMLQSLRPDDQLPMTEQLKHGEAGIRQLQLALQHELVDRGRVWEKCTRQQIAPDASEVRVRVAAPVPTGIKDKMLLFVFEAAELTDANAGTGGAYLGEFKVTGVDETGNVTLAPAQKLTERKLAQLQKSQPAWLLFEQMPNDRHSSFATLDKAKLEKLIPENSQNEYLQDGREAEDSAPADRLSHVWVPNKEGTGAYNLLAPKADEFEAGAAVAANAKNQPRFEASPNKSGNYDLVEGILIDGEVKLGKFYARELRDYDAVFRHQYQNIWHIDDVNRTLGTQVARFKSSVDGIKGNNGAMTLVDKQIAELEVEKKKVEAERDLVVKLAADKAAEIESLHQKFDELLSETKKLAARFTAAQLEAAARIDALTERAAR